MKLNARRCWLIAGLAMGVMGSSAVAQVAPPPTQPAKQEPKYQPPVKAAPTKTQTAKPLEEQQIARPKATPNPTGKPGTTAQSLPTNTPYPKLAKKGEDGKVIRLVNLPDILALRSNPTVGQKSVDAIMPVLHGRRARFERLVIDNLDLFWMVTDGRLETVSLTDIKGMAQIAEMIKPLVGRTSLSQELRSRGILTRTQAGMNEYIVNEYKQAITNEIQFESDDALSEVMQFVLNDSIHETTQAYRAMIAESVSKIGDIIEETGLSSSAAMNISKLQSTLKIDLQEQVAQLAEFDSAFRALDLEEAITVFTAMRNKRKNADFSPDIKRPNVMHATKVDTSGKGMHGTVKFQNGREFDTKELENAYDERMRKEKEQLKKDKAISEKVDD